VALDPALNAVITGANLRVFHAVQLTLPSRTVRLIDGSGVVSFPVNGVARTFDADDAIFGTLATVGTVTESFADQAARLSITLLPPTSSALGELADPELQGSPVRVWFGVVNPTTGAVEGVHEMWAGRIDVANIDLDQENRSIEIECSGTLDWLFLSDEFARLNSAWHTSIWPEETGLDGVWDATVEPYWGGEAPQATNNQGAPPHGLGGFWHTKIGQWLLGNLGAYKLLRG
jgi:hypothetical protein